MAKGFGIAALILAILAIFIPLVGIFVSGVALALALVSAFAGDRMFVTATSLIALVNTFFFSPSVMLVLKTSPIAPAVAIFLLVCGTAPVGVVIGKSVFDGQHARRPPPSRSQEPAPSQPLRAEAAVKQPEPQTTRQVQEPPPKPTQAIPTVPPIPPQYQTAPVYRANSIPSGASPLTTGQRVERMILIAFSSVYVIYLIAPTIANCVPMAAGEVYTSSRRYFTLLLVSSFIYAIFSAWFLYRLGHRDGILWGSFFGATGFVLCVLMNLVPDLNRDISRAPGLDTIVNSFHGDLIDALSRTKSVGVAYWMTASFLVGTAKEFFMLRPRD